jgi:hypothetical protein
MFKTVLLLLACATSSFAITSKYGYNFQYSWLQSGSAKSYVEQYVMNYGYWRTSQIDVIARYERAVGNKGLRGLKNSGLALFMTQKSPVYGTGCTGANKYVDDTRWDRYESTRVGNPAYWSGNQYTAHRTCYTNGYCEGTYGHTQYAMVTGVASIHFNWNRMYGSNTYVSMGMVFPTHPKYAYTPYFSAYTDQGSFNIGQFMHLNNGVMGRNPFSIGGAWNFNCLAGYATGTMTPMMGEIPPGFGEDMPCNTDVDCFGDTNCAGQLEKTCQPCYPYARYGYVQITDCLKACCSDTCYYTKGYYYCTTRDQGTPCESGDQCADATCGDSESKLNDPKTC